jgi:AcrR family transcriptional regulator
MTGISNHVAIQTSSRRLSKGERRRQLLYTALLIVREEGADRLTLGNLASRAGISKPVVYEHFGTRSGLLIELYRWIDDERVRAFRTAMAAGARSLEETIHLLAEAYIRCAADMTDEFHTVGAALTGSEEKAIVFMELLDNSIQMFAAVLKPFDTLSAGELEKHWLRRSGRSAFIGCGASDFAPEGSRRGLCIADWWRNGCTLNVRLRKI